MKHFVSVVVFCCILGIACSVKAQSLSISVSNIEQLPGGKLRNRGGNRVDNAPSEGLLREDGRVLYPVEDDIPVMLIEESIEL